MAVVWPWTKFVHFLLCWAYLSKIFVVDVVFVGPGGAQTPVSWGNADHRNGSGPGRKNGKIMMSNKKAVRSSWKFSAKVKTLIATFVVGRVQPELAPIVSEVFGRQKTPPHSSTGCWAWSTHTSCRPNLMKIFSEKKNPRAICFRWSSSAWQWPVVIGRVHRQKRSENDREDRQRCGDSSRWITTEGVNPHPKMADPDYLLCLWRSYLSVEVIPLRRFQFVWTRYGHEQPTIWMFSMDHLFVWANIFALFFQLKRKSFRVDQATCNDEVGRLMCRDCDAEAT